jgi:hypothetical protein
MLASGLHAAGNRLTAIGDGAVAVFGFLLCAGCIFSVFWLGLRVMSTRRYKPVKHKRGRRARQLADRH